jgi:hypothetical protein
MHRPLLAALALLITVAPAAWSKEEDDRLKRVAWHYDLAAALKAAKERGSMLFLAMILDDEPANVAQDQVFRDPAFIKASEDFVCVYANPYRGAKGGVAWNQSLQNYPELHTTKSGDTKAPFHLVADAKGKVITTIVVGTVEGGFDTVPLDSFLGILQNLVRKHGKGLTTEEYETLSKDLREGERRKNLGQVPEALGLFAAVVKRNRWRSKRKSTSPRSRSAGRRNSRRSWPRPMPIP